MTESCSERLLLKPGRKLYLLNAPAGIFSAIGELPPFARMADSPQEADVCVLFVHTFAELMSVFAGAIALVKEDGLFWVAFPKKNEKMDINLDRDHVSIYVNVLGWQGRRLAALNDTWTALLVTRK